MHGKQPCACGHGKSIHNVDLAVGTRARQIASRTYYFYQIVETCLQLRIFASLVTNAIPSASAVAPIRRSHGSLELFAGSWLASTATFAVSGRIATLEEISST